MERATPAVILELATDGYYRLPLVVREQVDAWIEDHLDYDWRDRVTRIGIVEEGVVEVEYLAYDDKRPVYCDEEGRAVTEVVRVAGCPLPPAEAFRG